MVGGVVGGGVVGGVVVGVGSGGVVGVPPYTSNSESCPAGQPVLPVTVSRT